MDTIQFLIAKRTARSNVVPLNITTSAPKRESKSIDEATNFNPINNLMEGSS